MSSEDSITHQSVLQNVSWLAMSNILSYALLFFSTIYIARVLEPDDFGRINFAQTVGLYLALLTDGMKLFGVREIAQNRDRAQSVVDGNLVHILSFSLVQFGVCLSILLIMPIEFDFKFLLIAFVLSSFIMAAFFTDWIYQGYEVMRVVAMGNLVRYALYVVLVLAFLVIDANMRWVGVATLVGALLAAAFMIIKLRLIGVRLRFGLDFPGVFKLGRLKIPFVLGLTSFRNQLFYTPVTVILGLQALHGEVGIFNAAFKLAFFIGSLGNVFVLSVFPRITSYCAHNSEKLQDFLSRSMRLMNYFLIPIGFGGVFLAKQIVFLIFGEPYLDSSFLFGVILWAVILMLLTYNYSSVLIGYNRQDVIVAILLSILFINILSNVVAIYYFKVIGAVFVCLGSEAIVLVLLIVNCKKLFGINIKFNIVAPVSGSIFMVFVLYILNFSHAFVNVVAGVASYILFIRFFAGVKLAEIIRVDVAPEVR